MLKGYHYDTIKANPSKALLDMSKELLQDCLVKWKHRQERYGNGRKVIWRGQVSCIIKIKKIRIELVRIMFALFVILVRPNLILSWLWTETIQLLVSLIEIDILFLNVSNIYAKYIIYFM